MKGAKIMEIMVKLTGKSTAKMTAKRRTIKAIKGGLPNDTD